MTPEAHKIIDYIVFITASRYGITPDEIRLRTRRRSIVFPRQIAGAIIRETLGSNVSFKEIGLELGGIDYATVIHGIKTVNDMRDVNKHFAAWYEGAMAVVKIANAGIKLTVNKN